MIRPGPKRGPTSQQKHPQRRRLVVHLIVSRTFQRDRTFSSQSTQRIELFTTLANLHGVTAAKLPPTGGIVTKPFSPRRAGCDVLEPVDGGVGVFDLARPEPLDQYPLAVAESGRLIRS